MKKELTITRYPTTTNKSLQAWNAADEHIVSFLEKQNITPKATLILNDRFGFLGCYLSNLEPLQVIGYKSQEKAIVQNYRANDVTLDENRTITPLSDFPTKMELGIIKIPKSMELFRFYLQKTAYSLSKDGLVLCGFMTKYYNKQMIEISEEYFEEVTQSLAWKKSRVIILKKPKKTDRNPLTTTIEFKHPKYGEHTLKQFPGVFSSKHIDFASQFFIDHLLISESDKRILDLASGNGILALIAKQQNPESEIHLLDDSFLAIESSKINLDDANIRFHYNDSLEKFPDNAFDLVISNPPFHFDFETNIEISISLFRQVHACLKKGGKFKTVASKHLNFKTHLDPLFESTTVLAENTKFVIYESVK